MIEETVPALDAVQQLEEPTQNTQENISEEKVVEQIPVEDKQEKNWKEARHALKELRRQNEELRAHLNQLSSKNQPQEEEEVAPDDWITQKKLQRELAHLRAELKAKESETVVDRLKARFNDFDDVVSPENVEYLKENDPELALSLQALKDDPYQQGLAAYKLLKKTDYYLNRDAMKEQKKIQQNQTKPPSVNQVRKGGPLAEANRFDRGLTPELRKQLWQEMQDARKGA
jgi:predicted RNase H-like nuclease (RuvC/YqgF family)